MSSVEYYKNEFEDSVINAKTEQEINGIVKKEIIFQIDVLESLILTSTVDKYQMWCGLIGIKLVEARKLGDDMIKELEILNKEFIKQ